MMCNFCHCRIAILCNIKSSAETSIIIEKSRVNSLQNSLGCVYVTREEIKGVRYI